MKSQTSMVNEATFQEILLPSSGNLEIMLCIFLANMWTWMETVELADLDEKKLHNGSNQTN